MKAELNIKEAIKHYNDQRADEVPEMTATSLALAVLKDANAAERSKVVMFYKTINNHRKFVNLDLLIRIAEATGYPPEKLIKYTREG